MKSCNKVKYQNRTPHSCAAAKSNEKTKRGGEKERGRYTHKNSNYVTLTHCQRIAHYCVVEDFNITMHIVSRKYFLMMS